MHVYHTKTALCNFLCKNKEPQAIAAYSINVLFRIFAILLSDVTGKEYLLLTKIALMVVALSIVYLQSL